MTDLSRAADTVPAREITVILNPTSGSGEGARVAAEISDALSERGLHPKLERTREAGHAVDLAERAARSGVSMIVAAGGDGTVHEVVGGLLRAPDCPVGLGLIPIGRGNDFASTLGIRDRKTAYDVVARGVLRTVDVGIVEWDGGAEHFVNGMGTGIDVEVVRQITRARNVPKRLVYIVGLVRALARYRPIELGVRHGAEHVSGRIMMAAITNGSRIGGGFAVSPGARLDDGLLDLCFIEEVNLFAAAALAWKILRARHAGARAVTLRRAPQFVMEAKEPMFFQVDGELREPNRVRRLTVRSMPAALTVRVPRRPDLDRPGRGEAGPTRRSHQRSTGLGTPDSESFGRRSAE